MYVITVIPITRGILREHFTYYSPQHFEEGSVVWVPVHKREIPAVVVSVEPAVQHKAAIKEAGFQMRRADIGHSHALFSPAFIRATRHAARYFLGTSGSVLYTLVPKAVLERPEEFTVQAIPPPPATATKSERLVLQTDEAERFSHYRNLIREEFARGRSLFLCAPTIQEIQYLLRHVERGIEPYAFTLHGSLSKRELQSRWNAVLATEHPVVIIATGSFLALPRTDIGTYIVEHESSRSYKLQTRPYVDIRTFVEFIADAAGARIILSDLLMRVETFHRYKNGFLDEAAPVKLRFAHAAQTHLLDMRPHPQGENRFATPGQNPREMQRKREFEVLSEEFLSQSAHAIGRGQQVFIFSSRRGLAPLTVCEDCGNVVACSVCAAPAILHPRKGVNVFICHACGAERSALEKCAVCTSWKLKPLGIGTQRVLEALRKHFPDAPLFAIESDIVRTHKQAQAIAESFYATPGSILVGTEMALPYLTGYVAVSGVASMDSLLSLPEIRISERAFSLLLFLSSRTRGHLFVQTRHAKLPLLAQALQGNIADFYRGELTLREQFSYPPFSTLIKLTVEGTQKRVEADISALHKRFAQYHFSAYPPSLPVPRRRYVAHALLQAPHWPHDALAQTLAALPPHIAINVAPENLL